MKTICRIDVTAIRRGHAVAGETCDIPGVGPVSMADMRALLPDAMIACVITRGVDVLNVTHAGRRATAAMRTAMEWSVPHCSNIACDNTLQIEHDHRIDWAATHHTRLAESDHLCGVCHNLKSTENWQLVEGSGRRQFVPPGHPLHPGSDHRRGRRP